MLAGLLYFLIESAQAIFLIPLFSAQAGVAPAGQWALMSSAMPLVNLAFAGYGSLLVIAISRATDATAHLPDVRDAMRRALFDSAMVLLTAQVLFASWGINPSSPREWWALGLYFLAGHCRLLALNAYIALNGVRRVGMDKLLLLVTSSVTATLSVWAVIAGSDVLGVAMVVLACSALQAGLALGALRALRAEGAARATVSVVQRRLAALVWLSQVGGFLNLGVEIPVAKQFMAGHAFTDFAFASRAFQAPLAIVGLWCQISMPFWASAPATQGRFATLRLLRRPLMLVATGHLLLLGAPQIWQVCFAPWTGWALAFPPFFHWMVVNYGLAGMVVIIGSYLLAAGQTRHLLWASLTGMTAPLGAWAWAQAMGPAWFYAGFFSTTACVMVVHWAFVPGPTQERPSNAG